MTARKKEEDEISFNDVVDVRTDDYDERHVSGVLVSSILSSSYFKVAMLFATMINCTLMALHTDGDYIAEYPTVFFILDEAILVTFLSEGVLKCYIAPYAFSSNLLNIFSLSASFSTLIPTDSTTSGDFEWIKAFRILRLVRSFSGFQALRGVSIMVAVVVKSLPDMASIIFVLVIYMMIFGVFGVNMFGLDYPQHFGNLNQAMISLFICITQDGWVTIYDDLKSEGGMAMHVAGIYFFLFVTSGSFVFANILVAVVTTNLEIAMDDYMKQCAIEQKKKGKESDGLVHLSIEETSKQVPLMGEPCIQDPIENLDIEKFENLTLIIQLMKDNMEEYITFRQELDRIIQEVQELPVNQGRQEEMIRRHQMMRKLSDSVLKDSVASGRSGDVLSTLIMLEKANVINTEMDFVVQDGVRRRPRL